MPPTQPTTATAHHAARHLLVNSTQRAAVVDSAHQVFNPPLLIALEVALQDGFRRTRLLLLRCLTWPLLRLSAAGTNTGTGTSNSNSSNSTTTTNPRTAARAAAVAAAIAEPPVDRDDKAAGRLLAAAAARCTCAHSSSSAASATVATESASAVAVASCAQTSSLRRFVLATAVVRLGCPRRRFRRRRQRRDSDDRLEFPGSARRACPAPPASPSVRCVHGRSAPFACFSTCSSSRSWLRIHQIHLPPNLAGDLVKHRLVGLQSTLEVLDVFLLLAQLAALSTARH